MLAEYEGKVFKAEIKDNQVRLWKYVCVEGFEKKQTGRGHVYYEKILPIAEIAELFFVKFIAFIGNRQFLVDSIYADKLYVICDDTEYAESHGFSELERGEWIKKMSLEDFDGFQMIKTVGDSGKKTITDITAEQLKENYQKYVLSVAIRG